MKRYIKLIALLIKLNTLKYLVYRISIFINLLNTSIYVLTFWLSINITFQFTDSILGNSYEEVQLLMWLSQLWWYLYSIIGRKCLNYLDELIRSGTLDAFLLKPFKILPVLNFIDFNLIGNLPSIIVVVVMIFVERLIPELTPIRLIAAVVYLIIGALISYCMRLLISIRGLWTGYNVNTRIIILQLQNFVKLPLNFFNSFIRSVFTFIPVIFLVHPSYLILKGEETLFMLIGAPLSLIVLYLLVILYWNKGLKKYTGTG